MSSSAENIATVPADMVNALRANLYIEVNAATDELRRNPVPAGQQPDPDRYQRLEEARTLLGIMGHKSSIQPAALQVNLDRYHLPLLAALHGKLEADARELGRAGTARNPGERTQALARLDALGELISIIEARGGACEDADRQVEDQLERALEALGYDESRGDWWRVTYDGGDS